LFHFSKTPLALAENNLNALLFARLITVKDLS